MARLSARLSRYFSLAPRRSRGSRIHKSAISHPIVAEEDTCALLASPQHCASHADTQSPTQSPIHTHTRTDARPHPPNNPPFTPPSQSQKQEPQLTTPPPSSALEDAAIDAIIACYAGISASSPTPSSVYSSPSPPLSSPRHVKARLERLRDTPPALGARVGFDRETVLFGPERVPGLESGDVLGAGRAGWVRDWREGRRAYVVL
ncbi:uncharacterized protein M421DRAFT_6419 [Didymella exigua CBS 183.55]|uniref:Uncharacterized protein n=1 Tax=Didymella exigua CBS 183.55 TaxID=1150837 RepID=A0A6A5RI37_9PLEO|nr:uncharacterized protein M421DRAFT_6419 [Didymella exigua CBS 183.55]KAF1927229.1 hypothetical protein M421DRAFT_6419 [Didymella exigua CBS 183.55]